MATAIEHEFIAGDTDWITLSLGGKGAGKTFALLAAVRMWLRHGRYTQYHLVLPNYAAEQDGQYGFLKEHADRVFIYDRYGDVVANRVIAHQEGKKRDGSVFLAVDDATSQLDIFSSEPLRRIATESRHLGISLWLCAHAAKRVLGPVWRANVDNLLLYRLSNASVLKSIWEEWLSMVPDFHRERDFKRYYSETVFAEEHQAIFLRVRTGVYELLKGWQTLEWHAGQNDAPTKRPKTAGGRRQAKGPGGGAAAGAEPTGREDAGERAVGHP